MLSLDEPAFTVVQAAQAARIASVSTLRSWLQNGVISLGKSDTNATQGGTRKLSHRRVLQVAVMVDLIGLGVAPARAAKLALQFSDSSTSAGPDNGQVMRFPGELYPERFTVLVAHPHSDMARMVWAKMAKPGVPATPTTPAVAPVPGTPATSFLFTQTAQGMVPGLFLPLDPLVKRVHSALGLND